MGGVEKIVLGVEKEEGGCFPDAVDFTFFSETK